jgi:putative endonuclease
MALNNIKGRVSEIIACIILVIKGYKIIATNHKLYKKGTGVGEVDIICRKAKTIVFVEVKYRRNEEESSLAISKNQQARINNAVNAFISRHSKYTNYDIRIDAILFAPYKLPKHIKNAW